MTTVVTANTLYPLSGRVAAGILDQVLATGPDLVGLQEWYLSRLPVLRRYGDVRLAPAAGLLHLPGSGAFHWIATWADGNVVGARADRYDVLGARSVLLTGIGRSDRPDRFLHTEPPRFAAVGVFADRTSDRTVALISYHLVPGVESHGRYRRDRPRLVARHRQEVQRLGDLVAELEGAGHQVFAVGDANFHLQPIAGLVSAWGGREDQPGTFGRGKRKIDDVHGPRRADEVRLLSTASDHRALVATFA